MTALTRRGLAALSVGAAIASPAVVPRARAQGLTRVSVGQVTTTTLSFAPVVVAQGYGYFREEGLEVEILEFRGSGVLLPQLTSRRVTIGYPNPDILIVSHQPGKDPLPLRFFYNATRESGWEFVVPEASPIRTLSELRGKKIGIGATTFGNVPITRAMFREFGLEVGRDVELVPVGVGAPAFLAFRNGQVDALNLFDSQHATLEAAGTPIRRLPMPPKYLGLFSNGFIAHNDTIRDQPDMLARFGRAVAKGSVACEANPEAAVRAFWRAYPNQKPAQADDPEVVRGQVHVMDARLQKFFAFPQGEPRRFGAFLPGQWRDFIEVLHAGGELTTADIDPDLLYTNALVDGFNRFDADAVAAAARAMR